MKQYTKTIDNKTVRKAKNQIILIKDNMQIINPSEELLLEDGWEEYIVPEVDAAAIELRREESEARMKLRESDYKVLKCIEAYLCGEEMPYNIKELHTERNKYREKIK